MEQSFKFTDTLLINNPDALEAVIGNETLAVCGSARGMTSLVAYSLYNLDYFIGEILQAKNFEDDEFLQALNIPPRDKGQLAEHAPLTELIAKRNREHQRWGFKLPAATAFAQQLPDLLRNPVIVLCVRNPVAVARSVMTKNPGLKGGMRQAYQNATKWAAAMEWLMTHPTQPSIIIDMDAVSRKPLVFLEDFSSALHLSGDLEAVRNEITKKGYKQSEAKPGVTFIRPRRPSSEEPTRRLGVAELI